MIKPPFVNNQIYHIYNRGVEKRKVFLADKDFLRFTHDLFEFNDQQQTAPSNIKFNLRKPSQLEDHRISECLEVQPLNIRGRRKKVVEILTFCLMPNHFHLLLRQKVDGGIIKFMHKLGTGYTMYFNQKNERVGPLFQGRFKAVLVTDQVYLEYLPHYIHANPLDLIEPSWRNRKITNIKKVMEFLENYRWSSLSDYTGNKNFPSVTDRYFLEKILGHPIEFKTRTHNWLKDMRLEKIDGLTLE